MRSPGARIRLAQLPEGSICRFCSRSSGLLFREDIVTTFSGETVRKFRPLGLLVVGILVYSLVFSGWSGSGAITVTLSASETSLNPGQTVTVIATLTHDKADQGVTWSLTGPGTLTGNTTT